MLNTMCSPQLDFVQYIAAGFALFGGSTGQTDETRREYFFVHWRGVARTVSIIKYYRN